MSCVYRHVRLDTNQVFYVGVGSNMLRPYHTFGRNSSWYEITGLSRYRVDILLDDLTNEDAIAKEKEFILLYGRVDLGTGTLVNRNAGGQQGTTGKKNLTDAQRKALADRARIVFGAREVREKIAKTQRGRKHSQEHIQKILDAKIRNNTNKKTEEHRKNLSIAKMGKTRSIESRVNQSITIYKNTPSFDFSTINRTSLYNDAIVQIDPFTNKDIQEFKSIWDACVYLKTNPEMLYNSLRKNSVYCGFFWRRVGKRGR